MRRLSSSSGDLIQGDSFKEVEKEESCGMCYIHAPVIRKYCSVHDISAREGAVKSS
jgi:hypothetical protein